MATINEIGDIGKSVNLSVATRALNVTPDLKRVERYDEYPAELKKQKLKDLSLFLLFAAPAATLVSKGFYWWSILPGLIAFWNLYWYIMHRNASPKTVYESGLLIPAIITDIKPLQIVAMANMSTSDDDADVCWGVQRFSINELPLHNIKNGERVPCVAMFGGSAFAKVWSMFEVHPVCWATADISVLQEAIIAINEDEDEWKILETLAQKAAERDDVDFSGEVAYFNKDLSPRIDLKEISKKQRITTASVNNEP